MSGNKINFDDKKIKKSAFTKTEKIFRINDIDVNKILVSKNTNMVIIIYLNTVLGIMTMMLLDQYV